MQSKTQNIPQLRFPEFEGEWIKTKISRVANKITDGTHDTPKPIPNGIPYLTAIHVKNGCIDFDNCYYLTKEEHNKIYNRCNPENGDLLMVNIGAGTANAALVNVDFEFSLKNVALIKPNNTIIESKFFSQIQRKNSARLRHQISTGGAQPFLSLKEIGKLKLCIPTLVCEQQKIANFLTSVDKRINLLSKKRDLLQAYKNGIMQKVFSQELRFKDENGNPYPDWEEKRLEDILFNYRLGGNYKNSEVISQYPLIKMGNLGRGKINLNKLEYIPESESIDEIDRIKSGDLFFNTRNTLELVGKVAIWREELPVAYYNSNLMYMKFMNNHFMNYLLNSHSGIKGLRRLATGTTSVAAIYTKDLLKLKLMIPKKDNEQQKIANFLSAIDNKIEQVEKQIEKSQQFKKGLLQQMFV
ncbi:restriction endonuclease subunit S [Marinifilum sp. N1E240]|uniref:restriction endonuclease subunit S n=1 Tax=Marinifilum sp. N1E240 TaxID=2608082 RepID=UPI00128CDBB8|nr:restriction endonuclease subunit S [Marinifilum sp. N1E240]MPQ46990.1 restriction endonuclease subunit S [Marinifilum sp. N1E240]